MESLLAYAKSLSASEDLIWWLENVAKKNIESGLYSVSIVEHIIDWMTSSAAPKRLRKMSIKDADRLSKNWMEKNRAKGSALKDSDDDIELFMSFEDESRIVKLVSKKAFQREGNLMSHCLGGYTVREGFDIYSLRDRNNNPHATFEVAKNKEEMLQIKGKGNGSIHPKYIDRIMLFLEKLGFKLRPSDMVNLGYYHVPKKHWNFVKTKVLKNEKLVNLKGEYYVV